jgi:hypothetical protein
MTEVVFSVEKTPLGIATMPGGVLAEGATLDMSFLSCIVVYLTLLFFRNPGTYRKI